MSDSSSEIDYSPDYEPIPADDEEEVPSYLHEPYAADDYDDVYDASSGESDVREEDDDADDVDEDEDLKHIPSEGDLVQLPGLIAGYDRDSAIAAVLQWADDNGLVVSRRSSEKQVYFYFKGVGRVSQKKKSPAAREIDPKDSLLLRDNTYQSNKYDLNVGLFVGVNNFGQSVLLAQAVVVGAKLEKSNTNFLIGWRLLVWPLLCSSPTSVSRQLMLLKRLSPIATTFSAIGILLKMS